MLRENDILLSLIPINLLHHRTYTRFECNDKIVGETMYRGKLDNGMNKSVTSERENCHASTRVSLGGDR